jgi:anti-anti-sigma factor
MKIDVVRLGGAAELHLEGRLDREWAQHLSDTLEDLLQNGVRSLKIDFSQVAYASSAATLVLARWRQELFLLRGEINLISLPPSVQGVFSAAGWDSGLGAPASDSTIDLRQSSWHAQSEFAQSGQYEQSVVGPRGGLSCELHGAPERLGRDPLGPDDCRQVALPDDAIGLGLGAIGENYTECHRRVGELVAVAGCVAYFPSDGARLADYLVGGGTVIPQVLMASGMTCRGSFSELVRFSTKQEAAAVPLSELADVALQAAGGGTAGIVIAGESAGLAGARLRRSPVGGTEPMRFDVPAVREWLSFAPERLYPMSTTLIAGVVARRPTGPIRAHLRPLGASGGLQGHLHAAVFSYHPLPQRTVELATLVRGFFVNHELRDVLHLVPDGREDVGVDESALIRGVCWVAPITHIH